MSDFDTNSDIFVELFDELPLWSAPFGLKLLDRIRLKKHLDALDIGSGAGFPLTEIAMRLGKTSTIYGLDPWQAATKRTEKKLAYYGINNVKILQAEAESIPLPDNSIDLITSNNGLNNVSDINKALSECSRIMRKGAQLIHTMNLEASMAEFYAVMKEVLIELRLEECIPNMYAHIYSKRKPLVEITKMLKEHGFGNIKIEHEQFEYHFVDGSTLLEHYFIRLAFLDDWKKVFPEEAQKEAIKRIEQHLNLIAANNGGITLTIPFAVIDCEKL